MIERLSDCGFVLSYLELRMALPVSYALGIRLDCLEESAGGRAWDLRQHQQQHRHIQCEKRVSMARLQHGCAQREEKEQTHITAFWLFMSLSRPQKRNNAQKV
eukprot:scaffold18237_cov18-Prasinocladus_malaysianus.AAC.1